MGSTKDDEDVAGVQIGVEDKMPTPTKMKVQPPDHFPCCVVVRKHKMTAVWSLVSS